MKTIYNKNSNNSNSNFHKLLNLKVFRIYNYLFHNVFFWGKIQLVIFRCCSFRAQTHSPFRLS